MAELNVNRVKSSDIEFKDRLVAINRVTKVTKGGRTFTFAAIVVIGNENGVAMVLVRLRKFRPPFKRALTMQRRILSVSRCLRVLFLTSRWVNTAVLRCF